MKTCNECAFYDPKGTVQGNCHANPPEAIGGARPVIDADDRACRLWQPNEPQPETGRWTLTDKDGTEIDSGRWTQNAHGVRVFDRWFTKCAGQTLEIHPEPEEGDTT